MRQFLKIMPRNVYKTKLSRCNNPNETEMNNECDYLENWYKAESKNRFKGQIVKVQKYFGKFQISIAKSIKTEEKHIVNHL